MYMMHVYAVARSRLFYEAILYNWAEQKSIRPTCIAISVIHDRGTVFTEMKFFCDFPIYSKYTPHTLTDHMD